MYYWNIFDMKWKLEYIRCKLVSDFLFTNAQLYAFEVASSTLENILQILCQCLCRYWSKMPLNPAAFSKGF